MHMHCRMLGMGFAFRPMMCMCESRVAASDSHNADCSAFQAVSSIKNAAQFCLQHEFCWSAFRSAFQARSHLLLIRHVIAPGMIETTQPSERSTITCDRPPLSRRRGKDLASLQDTGYIRWACSKIWTHQRGFTMAPGLIGRMAVSKVAESRCQRIRGTT
jgi:hypothetical protein